MGEVSKAVAQTPKPIEVARKNRERFEGVLPSHIETKSFVGMAEGAMWRDDKLMEAATNSPQSLYEALMKCASLGHLPGTDEFYLTPRKKKGVLTIQGIEGYRGIVERMYRSGAVASVIVREVCQGDSFDFVEGQMDRPVHHIDWFGAGGRGPMIGVYAYAVMTSGAVSRVVVLSKDDVMAAKARSDAASSQYSPWNTDERAMWWKTAARRLEPWVPTSVEYFKERVRAAAEVNHTAVSQQQTSRGAQRVDTATGEVVDAELVDDAEGAASEPAAENIGDEPAVEWPEAREPGSGGES